MENPKQDKPSRKAGRGYSAKVMNVQIPIPEPGETVTLEVPRYNLTLLIERGEAETQEQLRGRYTPVAPIAPDRRLHAARLGSGAVKGKRISVTLCTQESPVEKRIQLGPRVAITLDAVTCTNCVKVLVDEGVEIKGAHQ